MSAARLLELGRKEGQRRGLNNWLRDELLKLHGQPHQSGSHDVDGLERLLVQRAAASKESQGGRTNVGPGASTRPTFQLLGREQGTII